jgi:hypothetical protein
MKQKNNGEVKKPLRQSAVIRITDRDDGKFNASINFEPSIQFKNSKRLKPGADQNIAVQVAWFVWNKLKEQQKTHIVLTDE